MLGYINVNREELKVKDFETYQAFYCGICQDIKEKYGQLPRFTLTYDMTFLAILLSGLYESNVSHKKFRCLLHPLVKKFCIRNEFTSYAADMCVILTYHNLVDDWIDDGNRKSAVEADILRRSYKKAAVKYPRQVKAINEYIRQLHKTEHFGKNDIDLASGQTGRMFSEVFKIYDDDVWNNALSSIGFYVGKFIYLMDAYEDVEKDIKTGSYNPFKELYKEKNFNEQAKKILMMMISSATLVFERLPVADFIDILRNILYSGVWSKFDELNNREKK